MLSVQSVTDRAVRELYRFYSKVMTSPTQFLIAVLVITNLFVA